MTLEVQTIVNLLAQVPLVGIFVWFVLKTGDRNQAAQEKRDEQWRIFLQQQSDTHAKSVGRLAEEIKELSKQTHGLTQVLIAHDKRAAEFMAEKRGK